MQPPRALVVASLLALPSAAAGQWIFERSGTTMELRGLSVASDRVVWASGRSGTVARSTDGGRTWTADSIPGYTGLDLRAIHALNDDAAFAASAGEAAKGHAKILASGDAGRHWNLVYETDRAGVFLDAIAFWDPRHGLALSDPVDGAFFVLVTRDGGRSWSPLPAGALPPVLPGEAAFAASGGSLVLHGDSTAWIGTGGGGRARVMRTTDRGRTWSVVDVPVHADGPAAGIFALAFHDADTGVAVGGDYTRPHLRAGSVALTSDGGRTWRPAREPPAAYLSSVAFAGSPAHLVAVGLAGTFVSRDGGDRWTHVDTIPLNAVRYRGTAGFAVGPGGRVARARDHVPR